MTTLSQTRARARSGRALAACALAACALLSAGCKKQDAAIRLTIRGQFLIPQSAEVLEGALGVRRSAVAVGVPLGGERTPFLLQGGRIAREHAFGVGKRQGQDGGGRCKLYAHIQTIIT